MWDINKLENGSCSLARNMKRARNFTSERNSASDHRMVNYIKMTAITKGLKLSQLGIYEDKDKIPNNRFSKSKNLKNVLKMKKEPLLLGEYADNKNIERIWGKNKEMVHKFRKMEEDEYDDVKDTTGETTTIVKDANPIKYLNYKSFESTPRSRLTTQLYE